MKSKILILLNLLVMGGLTLCLASLFIQYHYYREFTGFVLRETAERIEAGESDKVRETLGSMGTRPSYGALVEALKKLNPSRMPSKHATK